MSLKSSVMKTLLTKSCDREWDLLTTELMLFLIRSMVILHLLQVVVSRLDKIGFCWIHTLMKSFFFEPYSSKRPRGAEVGTKRMDLKVTSPSAVKWMWAKGSSLSCRRKEHLLFLHPKGRVSHTLQQQYGCTNLRESLIKRLVFILLHFLSRSLPDGLDVVHQLPVPHSLLNLKHKKERKKKTRFWQQI